jgi:hypothetical protein
VDAIAYSSHRNGIQELRGTAACQGSQSMPLSAPALACAPALARSGGLLRSRRQGHITELTGGGISFMPFENYSATLSRPLRPAPLRHRQMDHWPPLLADRRIAPARLIYDSTNKSANATWASISPGIVSLRPANSTTTDFRQHQVSVLEREQRLHFSGVQDAIEYSKLVELTLKGNSAVGVCSVVAHANSGRKSGIVVSIRASSWNQR